MLNRIVAAEARPKVHIWIRFEDGLEGEISVGHLVGRGVFSAWDDESEFQKISVDPESGTVAWPSGLDLAPDALRTRLLEVSATPTAG